MNKRLSVETKVKIPRTEKDLRRQYKSTRKRKRDGGRGSPKVRFFISFWGEEVVFLDFLKVVYGRYRASKQTPTPWPSGAIPPLLGRLAGKINVGGGKDGVQDGGRVAGFLNLSFIFFSRKTWMDSNLDRRITRAGPRLLR